MLKPVILFCALVVLANSCNVKRISSKLICYYSNIQQVDNCYCTHVVLPANTDVTQIDNLRKKLTGVKILLTVNEFNQGLVKAVKQNTIDGLELNLKKLSSKEDVTDFISTVRSKLGNDLFLALSIPPKTELLAKYYDLKALTKTTDLFILQTSFLGASKNVTFHPSRLSGMWDMQNTDSVVDLVTGLGAPLSRLVVTAPVQAFQFRLQDSSLTTPGSPALEIKSITRQDLCDRMNNGEKSWTMERDQDQAGPYIFRGTEWIAFEDTTSLDIKAKYTRVRGMAGLALKDVSQDFSTPNSGDECGSLLQAAHAGLSKQNRVPRGAVLRSLEREILETPVGHLQRVEVSPYRITRIVDTEGHVHSVRKDTRTEFTCSRQGYFVHPSSCGRFYRCVKFDQLSSDFSVFEFDCPAGLAFDERVEVCVWPGSISQGAPCHGSSEIAPVPRQRFRCPQHAGYFADPENCRWFFACLDHGQSEMVAYEFRCPFGLVFDEQNLLCQWPWLVSSCGAIGTGLELDSIDYYGGGGTLISGMGEGQGVGVGQAALVGQLDNYDGLGNLGVVALGGYQGDINLLKNNLQSHGISDLNLGVDLQNIQSGDIGLASGLSSLNLGINSGQNIGVLQTNAQGLSASDLNLGVNLAESSLGSGQQLQSGIGLFQTNAQGLSASDLNLGVNLAESSLGSGQQLQSGIGLGTASSYSSIENSGLGIGLNLQGASLDNNQDNIALLNVQEGLSTAQGISGDSQINLGSVSIQDSGLSGNLATSSINLNNYENDQSILVSTARPIEQQAVLVDSNLNNQQVLLSNAQSSGANSYQSIEQIPTKVSSVAVPVQLNSQQHSGTLDYNYQYANEAKYVEQPIISQTKLAVPLSYGTSLTHIQKPVQYAQNYIAVTPKSEVLLSRYQTQVQPVVQPVVLKEQARSQSYASLHQYQTPVAQLEQQVQVQRPVVQLQQAVQPVVLQSQGAKAQSYSTVHQYQNPVVQLEKVQPVVQQTVVQQPVVYEQKVQPVQQVVLQAQKEQSNSYASVQHYQTPVQHVQTVVEQPIVQVQKVQPIVYEQKIQPVVLQESAKSNSYSSIHQYQTPVVQLEQKVPIVQQEIVQPVVQKVQPVNSYASVQHYQTPVVQNVVQQPVVYEQRVQPVVQKVQPVVLQAEKANVNSYSSIHHYQSPTVQLEQQVVQQPVVYEQRVQPVVQKVQPVVLQAEKANVNSYSSVHHYQSPTVQLEQQIVQPVVQQPVVFEQRVQPVVQKVQPVVLQAEKANVNSYSSVHHYQSPTVQLEQQVVQPVVQQPVVYEQRVQPVVQKVLQVEKANVNSYASVNHYQSPTVQLEQQIVQQPVVYEQRVQPVVQKVLQAEKANVNSYASIQHYQSPVVQLEQQVVQPVVQQPVVYEQRVQPVVQKVLQAEKANINSYASVNHYQSPVVQLEQKVVQQPIVYEQRVQPIVQKVQPVQSVVLQAEKAQSNSYSSIHNYQNQVVQPVVQQPVVYEQKVQPIVQQPVIYEQKVQPIQPVVLKESARSNSYASINHYVRPTVYEQRVQQPVVQQEVLVQKPVVPVVQKQQAYSSYYYQAPVVQQEIRTPVVQNVVQPVAVTPKYEPVQPVVYEQRPVVQKAHTYQSYYQSPVVQSVTPIVPVVKQPSAFKVVQPVVSTVTPQYDSYSSIQHVTPTVQPITYEARVPVVEPKIVQKIVQPLYVPTTPRPVSNYYVSTPRPKPVVYVSTTPKYAVFQDYVQPKQTYEIQKVVQPVVQQNIAIKTPVVKTVPTIVESYNYLPPKVVQEDRQYLPPVSTSRTYLPAKVLVQEDRQYLPPVSTSRTYLPAKVVSTTPKLAVLQPVQKVQPTVISEYQYENPEFAHYESNLNFNSAQDLSYENVYLSTERPISTVKAVPVKSYQTDIILSSPRPSFVSTIAPIVKQTPVVKTKVVAVNKFQTYDDQYLVSTPKPIYISTPAVSTEVPLGTFRYYDSRYDTSAQNQFLKEVVPVTTTIRPVQRKKIVSTTTQVPLDLYDYDFDAQYVVSTKPTIATTYRPRTRYTTVSTTLGYEDIDYVTTPRVVAKKKKITTTIVPEYEEISTVRPVKITPRPKTVVRVNDFHPFLTTKLGAQCECASNTLKLKSKQTDDYNDQQYDIELPENVPIRKITSSGRVSSQDLEEPGVYVVDSNDYDEYEPRKVVPVTKSPIRVTTNAVVPAPRPEYIIRRKTTARPIQSTTVDDIVDEVFIRKSSKEAKIAEAVNEGLKAIKGIVKEAVREEVRNFDRYGPGGWRSRDETLQGSVDCQRTGLFRHPTQCNKFYACHWDCTKQRYTLHVFNCPVHLTFDTAQGACNWPSKGPACTDNTLLPSS